MSKGNRGIGPVPEGIGEGLSDFLLQVRRHITDVLAGKVTVPTSGTGGGSGGTVVVIGGSPGPGSSYEPDLTPPPAPTGVVITGGFASVIFETDPPTFTQGHGHQKTVVYGKKYGGTGPLPTFSADAKQREFGGNIDAMPSDLGTRWHFWVTWVSKDGVESSQAGGVNGFQVTLGKIGHSDLGPLIVEADNLADGTVTAAKVAAGAVDLTKFANGIEPVTIIADGALPTTFVTKTIFYTDGKLYRWNGTAYTKAVDGSDIVANSITAGQIAAGAIGAEQIAAGAITTGKLLVTGRGAALNDDPTITDESAWSFEGPGTSVQNGPSTAAGATGGRFFSNSTGAADARVFSRAMAVDPLATYRLSANLYAAPSNDRNMYVVLDLFDGNGDRLDGTATGWGGTFAGYVFGGAPPPGIWSRQGGQFGVGTPYPIPANAKSMRVGVWFQYNGGVGTTAVQQAAQDIRLERASDASLIVDGAIVAGKIAAGAIAVGSAAIADGAIRNALIENAAIDNAKIVNVSAAKLTAGSIAVGQHIQSSNYVAGVSGWRVNGDGFAEFGAASIRGQLTAAQINANGLTIRKPDGSIVLDASGTGTPIHYSSVMPDGGWLNGNISIGANGALSGAGGGQVTLPGMGQHSYRIYCFGYQVQLDGTASATPGVYVDGAAAPAVGSGGYTVAVISRATGLIVASQSFNILGGGTAPADMAAYLNALDSTKIVAIQTNDEPASNRLSGGLPAAMYRCGASRAVFGSPQFQFRSAYVLVGIAGCGEGNGAEFYQGAVSSDPNAWCDVGFTVLNGSLTGVSSSYTPRTLADYSYTGDLAANQTYLDGSGNIQGVSSGAGTTVNNGLIGINGSGQFYGGGAGTGVVISNNQLSLGSDGSLYSAGTYLGQTTLGGLGAGAMAYLNSITSANVSTYIASAAIDYTRIGVLQAANLSVVALTDTIRGGVTSPGRVEITTNRIDVYDDSNIRRVRLGLL